MARIAVIGAGLIGRAWAIVFARAGYEVALHEADPSVLGDAIERIGPEFCELAGHGLLDDPAAAAARVRGVARLDAALAGASLVQENVPEELGAKRTIFADLDRLAPADAILASSTSAIVASLFTEELGGRHRCLVAHPVNPPHLVPLVELVGSPWTAPGTIARAKEIYAAVGQVPIVVRSEIEGFVLNRLQGALLAEAFRLVGAGIVSPQDLDKTLSDGLGLRWSFMGPLATIELNAPGGIADYCTRYAGFYRRLQADPATPAVYDGDNIARILAAWGNTPSADELEARARWRDRRLAALRAHKKAQPDS
jgi:L-gulonate 3-dehydrogenase